MATKPESTDAEGHASIYFSLEILCGPWKGWDGRIKDFADDGEVFFVEVRKGKEIKGPFPMKRNEFHDRGARGR